MDMNAPQKPRILVAEDNADTQRLLRYILRDQFTVVIVRGIKEAIGTAQAQPIDLLLLDINLGEEQTGVDLLKELRALPALEHVPAVALTAYALPGDRERFLEAGFEEYISKPFTKAELINSLEEVLEEHRS